MNNNYNAMPLFVAVPWRMAYPNDPFEYHFEWAVIRNPRIHEIPADHPDLARLPHPRRTPEERVKEYVLWQRRRVQKHVKRGEYDPRVDEARRLRGALTLGYHIRRELTRAMALNTKEYAENERRIGELRLRLDQLLNSEHYRVYHCREHGYVRTRGVVGTRRLSGEEHHDSYVFDIVLPIHEVRVYGLHHAVERTRRHLVEAELVQLAEEL